MMKILGQIRKRPFTVCGVIGAVIFALYLYPAPILWLRESISEWWQRREMQWRADEMNAARELHDEGKLDAAAKKLERLLSHPPKKTYWPYPGHIRQELALVRRDQGRFEDALREVNSIIAKAPDHLDLYLTRIEIHFEIKQWREVLVDCETIADLLRKKEKLEKSDHIADYWASHNHAYAWIRLGEYERAEREIRAMIRIVPIDRRNYGHLAELYARQKDYKRALQYLDQAMVLSEPDWTDEGAVRDWHEVAYNLAELLAACPDASVRDGKRAKQIAEKLLEKTGDESPATFALAAAHAELGDFDKAVELQSQMMSKPVLHANSHHQQTRLESYKRKQPFRLTRYEEP